MSKINELLIELAGFGSHLTAKIEEIKKTLEHPDPAPERTSRPLEDPNVPKSGITKIISDPEPPLKAQVAEILGWEEPDELTDGWAIGALKEYCRKNSRHWRISNAMAGHCVKIGLGDDWRNGFLYINTSLSKAICLAIVKHSEGK
jgi:hypothetical protein